MTDEASLLPDAYEAPIAGAKPLSTCSPGTTVAGDCKCGSTPGSGATCDTGSSQC